MSELEAQPVEPEIIIDPETGLPIDFGPKPPPVKEPPPPLKTFVQVREGKIIGVQQSTRAIDNPELVEVAAYDPDLVGRAWVGDKPGPKPPAPPVSPKTPDWLEAMTEAQYTALDQLADTDYLVRQFLKVCELRGFVDMESDLTAAALSRISAPVVKG